MIEEIVIRYPNEEDIRCSESNLKLFNFTGGLSMEFSSRGERLVLTPAVKLVAKPALPTVHGFHFSTFPEWWEDNCPIDRESFQTLWFLLKAYISCGEAGLCKVCGKPSLHLVCHHWYEPSPLPRDKTYREAHVCERCNGVLYPSNLWLGLDWAAKISGRDHVLPAIEFQQRWVREVMPRWYSSGNKAGSSLYADAVVSRYIRDLKVAYYKGRRTD